MSYENAPATKMLATHCCACNRPLVDAKSVEYGIGPECRKRHGHGVQTAGASWGAVTALIGRLQDIQVDSAIPAILDENAHKLCNVLTHAAATATNKQDLRTLAEAIYASGYRNLALTISKRRLRDRQLVVKVWVEETAHGERVVLQAPWKKDAIDDYKRIGGRFDPESRTWSFATTEKARLWDTIRSHFAGRFMLTPKTEAVI